MGKKKTKPLHQKRLSEQNYLLESVSQILNQFDEQHASLLVSALMNCSNADKDMTLNTFAIIATKALPWEYTAYQHFIASKKEVI